MPRDDREQEQMRAILDLVERCDQADSNARPEAGLELEVRGNAVVVTMPGTQFSMTCGMLEDSQFWTDLVLDQDAAISPAEFLSRAWRAANDKARELGWVV
jgi:hypothetical protein